MKKNTKKQIPKVRLPKYKPGGLYENESGNAHEDAHSGSDNIYNEGRSNKLSNDQYGQMAQAGIQGGMQAYQTSQTPGLSKYEKNQQYGKSIENTEQGVVSAINPVFGMIHSGVGMIMNPLTAKATATDAEGNLVNRKQAKNQAIGRAFADPLAMLPTLISTGWNRDKYADQIESDAKNKIAAQKAQEDAYNQQQVDAQNQQNAYIQNAVQQGIAANNNQNKGMGVQYAKFGGLMKYGMGGMQYANGGTGQINAEVEGGGYGQDGENAVAPGGQFTQFNGPTHAQGGIQTDMAPGTRIFSDKIKIGNKTVAELNKPNNTNREDKLAAKGNLDPKTATSLALTKMAKMKNSDMLFNMQEQIKKDKVAAYAKKMGVQLPSMDNEQAEPQGMSEASEGKVATAKYGGMYAKGGIHINPANKGKFTASAQHAGMGTQEFARHVLANKEDYSSTQVKRANFAHNAAGWKHEMGGMQEYEMGGESEYNMLGNPDEPRPLNQKNAKVKAAIARNLNENPLVKDYNYRLQVDNKKGDRLFATGTDGKENEVFFQDLKTGKYNPAYNDTVRAAIKIKMEQDALNSVQKHALGGVQLPYYNTDNNGKPIYAMGGDYPAMTNPYHNFKGHVPMYAMGGFNDDPPINVQGLTKPQYEQAQRDSSVIYKSGLKQGPNYQFPGFTESSMREGSRINPRSPFIKTNTGQQYGSESGSNMMNNESSNFNNFKPTMVPWKEYVPTKSTEVNNKNVEHPKYDTFVPGIQKSKQPVIIEQYSKGGQMPKYAPGGWVPKSNLNYQEDQATLGYVPQTQLEANRMYQMEQNKVNPTFKNSSWLTPEMMQTSSDQMVEDSYPSANSLTNISPNVVSKNSINTNIAKGVLSNVGNANSQGEPFPNKINWSNVGTNVAMGLANNAGNIADLGRYSKSEVEKYQRMVASLVDSSAAMRDAEQEARRAESGIKNASAGSTNTYLANRIGLNASNIMNKDRLRQQYANINAGINNSTAQYNNELARQEVIANAQNRAAARSGKNAAIGSIGYNVANQMMDNKKGGMDQETLALMVKYYNDPQFKKYIEESKFNKRKSNKKSQG